MSSTSWHGIQSVLVTPFMADRSIDFDRFEALVHANIVQGADAVIPCGSTGEFYTMTFEERVGLFRAAVNAAAGRVPVIAGVADLRMETSASLCRAAEEARCSALLALPPIYAMPSEAEIDAYFSSLAGSTALPIFLYNSPRRAGVSLAASHVARLAERLPTVCGIKDSSGDILQVMELERLTRGRLAVLVGYETMIRPALAVGAHGVVAMAHQLSGRLVRAYYDACRTGDSELIQQLEPALFGIYACFRMGSYYAGIKAVMNALDQPVGDPRPPLLPFTEAQHRAVEQQLASAQVRAAIASVAGG